ncbi:MAG: DUF1045 domain-containing protein [Sneathiellales bacterium]|nr:DUF1045 domain-containing protein [Sneathiellales bacterium]
MTVAFEEFERYAIYYAPASESPLALFGNAWLGRDPANGLILPRPDLGGLALQHIKNYTRSPTRYGFHGTLKPPFALTPEKEVGELDQAITELAARMPRSNPLRLMVKRIGSFLALCPEREEASVSVIAASCVQELDQFRKPAREEELNRRRARGLSDQQELYLQKWGYPYVLDEFRFHLTLTDGLETNILDLLEPRLLEATQTLRQTPFVLDRLCLFGDPGAGAPFRLLKSYDLCGE